jgi:hypothetical protein
MRNNADRYWIARIIPVSIVYVISIIVCFGFVSIMDESPLRYLIAVIPAIPVALGTFYFNRYLGRLDEMQRKIQLNAIGFSIGLTGVITFTIGLLEAAGLPSVGLIWVYPTMIVLWGFGVNLASRRYK